MVKCSAAIFLFCRGLESTLLIVFLDSFLLLSQNNAKHLGICSELLSLTTSIFLYKSASEANVGRFVSFLAVFRNTATRSHSDQIDDEASLLWGNIREFKQITTAGATTAAVTEKVWGEYVSVV